MPQEHNGVVEQLGPARKGCDGIGQAERHGYDVHSSSGDETIPEFSSGSGGASGSSAGSSVLSGSETAAGLLASSDSTLVSAGFSSIASVDFWFFGVNFRPQPLQSLILRLPMVLVLRKPLLIELPPQYGHIAGLPLGISITSRDV